MADLSLTEMNITQSLIDKNPAGTYELKEIYGVQWSSIVTPTSFGTKFRKAVKAGHLRGIHHDSLRTNNHNTYVIFKDQ